MMFLACQSEESKIAFDTQAYETNFRKWRESARPNYSFTQEYFSLSTGPSVSKVMVEIKNSELDTVYAESKEYNLKESGHFKNIDELYLYINSVLEESKKNIQSENHPMERVEIRVDYDETYNYPKRVKFSGSYPNGYYGGLGSEIVISDFKEN